LELHRVTGEVRWADLFRRGAADLDRAFAYDGERSCYLWTQMLYGQAVKLIGAVHGFAGVADILIRGADLLQPAARDRWFRRFAETLAATAIHADHAVNWPQSVGPPRPGRSDLLVQHCHGAAGVVTSMAALPEPIDGLLLAGGNLVWTAGPLAKGPGLCHGAAGNGFAFLKLFQRTGDEIWLARARAFGMHAIAQSDRDAAAVGRRRYALWTGDIGLACFLWECIRATARFPTIDVL
jgi:hypothetical protein